MAFESPDENDGRIDVGAVLAAVWARKIRIVLVTLLLLAATYAILMFVPKMYESSASILVEPRDNSYTRAAGDTATATTPADATVVSSQIELIKSRDTLIKVIDSENLRSVPEFSGVSPGPMDLLLRLIGRTPAPKSIDEVAVQNLNDRLTVIQERDSRLISILVRSTDPELAARIANAIAAAHVARRAELSLSDTAEASVWLEQEIDKLRTRVNDAESKVAAFKVQNDMFDGGNNTSLIDQQLSTFATQIAAAQERQSTAASRAAMIRQMVDAGQPIDGIPDVRDSVVIQQMTQSKATLQGERAQRSATLLANHPTIRALDAQINELSRQINLEGIRVASALEAQAQIEAETVSSLQDQLARLKVSAGTATTDTVQLQELEREAKAQRDLLESYLLRYRDAVSRSDSSSAFPDVRVVSLAAPSLSPASPKTGLILMAVAIVSLALQLGAIIFGELLSGRAITYRTTPLAAGPAYVADALAPEEPIIEPAVEPVTVVEPVIEPDPVPAAVIDTDAEPEFVVEPEPEFARTAELEPSPTVIVSTTTDPAGSSTREAAEGGQFPAPSREMVEGAAPSPTPEPEHIFVPGAEVASSSPMPEARGRGAAPGLFPGVVEGAFTPTFPDLDSLEPDTFYADHTSVADETREPPLPLIASAPAPDPIDQGLANLAGDIALGKARVVFMVGLRSHDDAAFVADVLVADALSNGVSACLIDAGSTHPTEAIGVTDLADPEIGYGDVVHRLRDENYAEIPWGQGAQLDRRSTRPATLVEALSDIYEVVIVLTGRTGFASTLPIFAGIDGRVVLVAGEGADLGIADYAESDAFALGFEFVQVVVSPERQAEVA